MAARAATWRVRIGGRWAVSWQGYLLLAALAVPLSLFVVPIFFTPDTWLAGLAVSIVAYLAAGGVLYAASVTVLRDRATRPVPAWWVAGIGGLAWLARSAVFGVFLRLADLPEDTPLPARLAVGFLLGAVLVPGVAWLLATLDEFGSERRRLVGELVQRELQAEDSVAYLGIMRNQLLSPIQASIRQAAERLPAGIEPAASPVTVAASSELAALDAALRQASRDLAPAVREKVRGDSRVQLGAVLEATARRPFALWPIPFFAALTVLYVARFTPLGPAVLAVSVAAGWSLLIAITADRVCVRRPRASVLLYALFVALLLMSGVVAAIVLRAISDPAVATTPLVLTLSVPFTLLMVGGGIAHGVNVAEQGVIDDLRSSISDAEVRRRALETEEARVRREIATHLHGTVAANVTAASMRLRRAIEDEDAEAAQRALVEARGLLEADLSTAVLVERSDLDGLLHELAKSWQGLARVEVSVSPHPALPPALVRAIVDIVTEGVSNAVRHGDAERIAVRVEVGGDGAAVEVADDGHRPATASRGLGSDIFDTLAPGAWSLVAVDSGGSLLTAQLPLS